MEICTRAELERQKETLTAKLKEVTERLDKFDETIYKGKFEKAIKLLKECAEYLNYAYVEFECEDCGHCFDLDIEVVIYELEKLYKREF